MAVVLSTASSLYRPSYLDWFLTFTNSGNIVYVEWIFARFLLSGKNSDIVSEQGSNLIIQISPELRKIIKILRFRLSCHLTISVPNSWKMRRQLFYELIFHYSLTLTFFLKKMVDVSCVVVVVVLWCGGKSYSIWYFGSIGKTFNCINRLKVEIDVNAI